MSGELEKTNAIEIIAKGSAQGTVGLIDQILGSNELILLLLALLFLGAFIWIMSKVLKR